MKYLNDFSKFNEKHVYAKATSKENKKLGENREKVIKYVVGQINQRQISDFKKDGDVITFKIKGRKYKINTDKICLYKKEKGEEKEVEIELTKAQLDSIISALKKPLESPKASDSTKKNPEGRKPYLD
jgi:hypothetical protein